MEKFIPLIGVSISSFFIYMAVDQLNKSVMYSAIFATVALLILEDCLRRKHKWLQKVRKVPEYNQKIEIQFYDDQVIIQGENFKSELQWDYFVDYQITKNGLFLRPMKGSSIFIHNSNFEDLSKMEEILKKLQ